MHTIDSIFKETELIKSFAQNFRRHPGQVNGLLEADAEILKLNDTNDEYLVLKTDGIYEEIKEGLYQDPYMIGSTGVTAPLSDLAAVGAEPTVILLSVVLKKNEDEVWLKEFRQGINDACSAYNIYVAGGDTNYDDFCSISTTAVGFIKNRKPMLRKGMKPGDFLYSTSFLGLGNAFAYSRFFDSSFQINYLPQARLKESLFISQFVSACIDTSDGLFPALAFLSDLNQIGFDLDVPLNSLLHDDAKSTHQKAGLPSWLFMAGPHGEYELLFSVPAEANEGFLNHATIENFQPVYIGKVTSGIQLNFVSEDLKISCHPAEVPNLFYKANGNIQTYFKLLMEQHKNWSSVKSEV
jgi:thiamine-monophosphate kinase